MTATRFCRTLALLGALPLAGCAASGPSAADPSRTEATSDLEALYWARQDSARAQFTEADVQFMTGMIGHHAQALIMSRLAPENGASPAVRTLAARIINAQDDEIASMQQWLRDRDQPVPEVHIDGLMLMIHMPGPAHEMDHSGHHGHAGMPGMLTQAQLEELAAAQGADFDRLFLTYMIQHHQGAITMVDDLFAVDGAALDDGSFKLASDIRVDQATEIARMQRMLDALPSP